MPIFERNKAAHHRKETSSSPHADFLKEPSPTHLNMQAILREIISGKMGKCMDNFDITK
jgi:hypothetical protein